MCIKYIQAGREARKVKGDRILTNGAMIPAVLPIVNCMPVAVVRLPYRGWLRGSQLRGIPTQVYRPSETRKQPK